MLREYARREEPGDGVSYAMYFVAIVIVMVLFVFFLFNSNALVAEEVLENGLHIAENKTLSVNQAQGYDYSAPSASRVDDFERDLDILHIVTEFVPGGSGLAAKEREQVEKVAKEFSVAVQEHLGLEGSTPTTGILTTLCPEGARVLIASDADRPISATGTPGLIIYEPVYVRNVTGNLDERTFEITYTANEWVVYEVDFNAANDVQDVRKSTTTVHPKLENGTEIEGATLEASLVLDIEGVRNIFNTDATAGETVTGANVRTVKDGVNWDEAVRSSDEQPEKWEETHVEFTTPTTKPSSFFAQTPLRKFYKVNVVQSADVVPASQDSRQR